MQLPSYNSLITARKNFKDQNIIFSQKGIQSHNPRSQQDSKFNQETHTPINADPQYNLSKTAKETNPRWINGKEETRSEREQKKFNQEMHTQNESQEKVLTFWS